MSRWTIAEAILSGIFHLIPIDRIAERASIRKSCRARQIRTLQRAALITAVFSMLIRPVNFFHPALLFISGESLVGFSHASWIRDRIDGVFRTAEISLTRIPATCISRCISLIAEAGPAVCAFPRACRSRPRYNRGETRDFAV